MSYNIKSLHPSKKSRYEQGYINTQSCKKLFESQRNIPIIFRSSLEKKFIIWCENNKNIRYWGSECVQVPYYDPRDKKNHIYNPDFFIEKMDGCRIAIEIKPYNQTVPPAHPFCEDYAWNTYIKNRLKWNAASKFFSERKIKFLIVTEKFFE